MAKTQQDNQTTQKVSGDNNPEPLSQHGENHIETLFLYPDHSPTTLGKSGKLYFSSQRGKCVPQGCETLNPFRDMDLKRFPRFPQDLLRLLYVLFLVL